MIKSEKILITGVAGFIGSHTCEKLLQDKIQIVGIDNVSDYYDVKLKQYNLNLLTKYDNFVFHKIDIRNYENLSDIFNKYSFGGVIHLAAQAGVRYSLENPRLYQETNVGGTLNLLEMARRKKCMNFVFASSSSVYGNRMKVPFSEGDAISQPISIYAATKQAGEALCYAYNHLYNININCLRFFTVYGPRGRPDMAPHIFTTKILNKETIKLFDNKPCTLERDFTYVSDIVEGIQKAFNYQGGFQIINLGFGSPTKVLDFLALIEKVTGKKAEIEYIGHQLGDVTTTYANCTKGKSMLKYKPRVNLKQGIELYFKWYKAFFEHPD